MSEKSEKKVITEDGKKALSVMLHEVMRREQIQSQEVFAIWLSAKSGVDVKEDRVYRLLKGRYTDATVSTLVPLIRADILKHPNGEAYTFTDLIDLLCGLLDPKSGKRSRDCVKS